MQKLTWVPYEVSIRSKIGEVLSLSDIDDIACKVEACLVNNKAAGYQNDIFNVGHSDQVAADLILKILYEQG